MRRLHPATIAVALLPRLREAVQTALPLIIGSFFAGRESNHDWIAIFIGMFTGVFAIGTYWTTKFDIVDGHVVHRTGWIFRKDRRIPLEQIQNVNIRQNLLERLFRVATVDVETALGKGRDLKLSVLGWLEAERFREELLGAAQLDPASAPEVEQPLVRLTNRDLLLGAITENHIQQMVLIMFTLGGTTLGVVLPYAIKLSLGASFAVAGGAVLLIAVGGWFWGVGAYYLKYGGFVVHRTDSMFRISYGLLNKVQMAIRPGRIEFLKISITIPQRWMERASFYVGTAGSFGEAGVLAPVALFVPCEVAYAGAAEVIPGLDVAKLNWRPLHPVFYWAAVTRSLVFVGVVALIAESIRALGHGAFANLVLSLLALLAVLRLMQVAAVFLSRAENAFAITEDALVSRRGYIHQFVSAIPIARIENIAISQPMWWRSRQAASLTVQGMKHRLHSGPLPESAIEELLTVWQSKIAQSQATV